MAATKKTTTKKNTTKKPAAKKTAAPKKETVKKTTSASKIKKETVKKPAAKKTAAPKKTTTKTVSPKKTSTSKSSSSKTNNKVFSQPQYVTINRKKIKLPKRVEVESYSCIWRMYSLVNPKTKQRYTKRFWIVIGDGHKRYRKFETQREAIEYFRELKKYAKMRVQSVGSKKFIRTVYTFFEMKYKGIDLESIKVESKPTHKKSSNTQIIEEEDFEDEFTQFDTDEIDDDQFDEEEINRVLAESEGDAIIVDDVIENDDDDKRTSEIITTFEEEEPNEEQKFFELVDTKGNNTDTFYTTSEVDPYAVTQETTYENNLEQEEPTINEDSTNTEENNLYYLTSTTSVDSVPVKEEPTHNTTEIVEEKTNEEVTQNNAIDSNATIFAHTDTTPVEDDMSITQHHTSLTETSDDVILEGGKHKSNLSVIYWLIVILICLLLATIVVLSLCLAAGII